MSACTHKSIEQVADALTRSIWERQEDGSYQWNPDHDETLSETTVHWRCNECDEFLDLDDDQRIEGEEYPSAHMASEPGDDYRTTRLADDA